MSVSDISLNLVDSWEEVDKFRSWFNQPHGWVAVDTETGGLDWWRDPLRLVQVGDANTGWAIPWTQWGGVAKQAVETYPGPMVMHNSKFDLHFLEHNGIKFPRHLLHDSMPLVGLVEPLLPKGLKPASERHVFEGARSGDRLLQSVMDKNKWTWATIPIDIPEYWGYAALDVVLTARLQEALFDPLARTPAYLAYTYEVAVAQVLCNMERRGMLLNNDYIIEKAAKLQVEEDRLRNFFLDELGVDNPLSDRKLVDWFQEYGYRFTKKTKGGLYSLDSDVLKQIAHDRPELKQITGAIVNVRNYHKIRGTYFDAFLDMQDKEARLHTSINPLGAVTGRMSASRPNLQNIPAREQGKLVRSAFIASPGHSLISADFDQIEYRILVSRAGEQRLIDAILAGQDLHTYMTAVVYKKRMDDVLPNERSIMKNATFAFLYGAGDVKFALMAGIAVDEARAFRNLYAEEFPAIASYAQVLNEFGQLGKPLSTEYLGRPQQVEHPRDESYKLLNYATQGEAGDVLKRALVNLSNTDVAEYMVLPIHDEILFDVPSEEVPRALEIINEVMPEMSHYKVPLSVGTEVVSSWGDKYK